MPFPSETYLNLLRTLGTAVPNEFESLYAQLEGWMSAEHKDDGSHADITADTLTVTGTATIGGDTTVDGDGTFTGNVTAQSGESEQVDIGAGIATNPGLSGIRVRNSQGDWAIGPVDTGHAGGLVIADMLNTSVTNRQVLALKATSAFGTPTQYALVPGNNNVTQIDIGAYQATAQSAGAMRSVNVAEANAAQVTSGTINLASGVVLRYNSSASRVYLDDGAGNYAAGATLYARGGVVSNYGLTTTANGTTPGVDVGDVILISSLARVYEANYAGGMGHWTTVAHAGGNFTASSGTWTVDSGDQSTFAYTLVGKTMTVAFVIQGTDVSATPVTLQITIPGSFTAAKDKRNPVQIRDAGTFAFGLARVVAGDTKIYIYPSADTSATWTATSSDNTNVSGEITFEVQ